MSQINNPMSIMKILDKSNCRKCGEKTCLAFAASVARGQKNLIECPNIPEDIMNQFTGQHINQSEPTEEILDRLKSQFLEIDLKKAAEKLGGAYRDGELTLKVCGKNVSIDTRGNFHSEIHIHSWLTIPTLDYIVQEKGLDPSGQWLSFRELKDGQNWYNFFAHRCEMPIKKIADNYTDFFEDMLHIFNGKKWIITMILTFHLFFSLCQSSQFCFVTGCRKMNLTQIFISILIQQLSKILAWMRPIL